MLFYDLPNDVNKHLNKIASNICMNDDFLQTKFDPLMLVENGYLDMLKWVYSINKNKSKYYNFGVHAYASYYGHFNILKWAKEMNLKMTLVHEYELMCNKLSIPSFLHPSECNKMHINDMVFCFLD